MFRILIAFAALCFCLTPQISIASDLQSILQENQKAVERASRKTITPVLDALAESQQENISEFLENWRNKNVWIRKSDKQFFYVADDKAKPLTLIDIDDPSRTETLEKKLMKQLKPNSGVRGVIASALVQFQLSDPSPEKRLEAIIAIERGPEPSHLDALRTQLASERDTIILDRMKRLERILTIAFDEDDVARITAIESFAGDTNVDVRAALNPILTTRLNVATVMPATENVAKTLEIGVDIDADAAYQLLVDKSLAPQKISVEARDAALVANIENDKVADIEVSSMADVSQRIIAYQGLADQGLVPIFITADAQQKALDAHVFYEAYLESNKDLTDAAQETVTAIDRRVGAYQIIDLGLDGLSLASIYFLAAIGLAITFGVMGVINMAHGEFIMIGAYTGYVVQQFIPNYTISILVALPLAFLFAFGAGVALERLVIRHLMHRPLETLLATFGISIALQQLAKNIFGTQARPLTSPDWLDGALVINDVISISYIRIAIFVLALIFFALLWFILNKTRLGLEVRAVTQNPRMASSMGINPDKINMLTFGLGSGIAGIAGVAIGLFAQVTSELGSGYIVQSFMTVVVGGVGSIWGTLAGAGMIGGLQKIIEFFNPSNTLAAQTYMIIFIIIFIQFRPKGIIALKGRAAGD